MAEGKDIIVIGGSAGSLRAIKELLRALSADVQVAVLVVIHSSQESPGYLARILGQATSLNVRYAEDREPIELGTVYVAPADRHLLVKPGEVRVVRGPKENNFRPAIDPLFRSAAYTYGPRVIGVVLSGLLDDGSHGLFQIERQGGVTVVQDPSDAEQPSMPQSAIAQAKVDHVVPAAEMGELLNKLTRENSEESQGPARAQLDVSEGASSGLEVPNRRPSSTFVCPECRGALWEIQEGDQLRYRCHVGHGYSGQTLSALHDVEIEQALWTSVRLLEEQAELQERMAEKWKASANRQLGDRFASNADDRKYTADLIRSLITGQKKLPEQAQKSPQVVGEYGFGSKRES
ncbi:MAG TPA: chemotaxis protein CheB [Terriglobales bacterium]|jgi:two-component system chemotaxis response regulator CheB|nr:chemotaxis protein CheB [Terriglobales bacterium]